jgi:hypothetical protein
MDLLMYIAVLLGMVGAGALCVQLLVGTFHVKNALHQTAKVIASAGCGGALMLVILMFVVLLFAALLGF